MAVEAITITGTIQHQAWQDRVLPPVERVRPGLWSVPTVFPDNPLRYVLAYVFELPTGGVAVVDTGWPTEAGWDGLVGGLRQTGWDVSDVKGILITHSHADHYGLAEQLRAESGAWIGMHEADAPASARPDQFADFTPEAAKADSNRTWLAARGVPIPEMPELPSGVSKPIPVPDVLIADGDLPLGASVGLKAIWTPGHTPGHLCFADTRRDLLLTGDQLLPRITPNISHQGRNEGNPLGDYLHSLVRMAALPYGEILPAHEYRFIGLDIRVRQLLAHHAARLWEIVQILEEEPGATTDTVAQQMHWSRPWSETLGVVRRSALGEAFAHLMHLQDLGLARNVGDGVDEWRLAPEVTETLLAEGIRAARPVPEPAL